MGSAGCFGNSAVTGPKLPARLEANGALKAQLRPVLRASARALRAKEPELVGVFAALEDGDPDEVADWLSDYASCSAIRARAGVITLMQRLIAHGLGDRVAKAEEQLGHSHTSGEPGEGPGFAQLAQRLEEALVIDEQFRAGVKVAAKVLCTVCRLFPKPFTDEPATPVVVPDLDRLVLLFRRAALASVGGSGANLQTWKDLEAAVGLPPLERHLPLLGRKAKFLLLSLSLVPEGRSPVQVVVTRDTTLADAEAQLPETSACVLSCYFESTSGTKVVKGRRVEGGEGHGPRKEFFVAASADAIGRFGAATALALPGDAGAATLRAAVSGNRLTLSAEAAGEGAEAATAIVAAELAKVQASDRITLHCQNGVEVAGVVSGKVGAFALMLSQPVKSDPVLSVLGWEVQKPATPLLEFHRGTGQHWFGAHADDLDGERGEKLRARYRTLGKVIALSITNHCKLSFVLPTMFFRVLLRRKTSFALEDLRGFDNALHASMKKVLKMRPAQFGALKEVEGLPEAMTREEYVAAQVAATFCPKAMHSVREGFEAMAPLQALTDVTANELRHIVCPTETHGGSINIRHIFDVVMEDEMAECTPFVEAFWHVIDGLSAEEKKRFLVFVTGLETPPEPGSEQLLIQLPFSAFTKDEHIGMLNMLPQAHTCTNTLEMPNYYEALVESGRFPEGPALNAELRRVFGEKLRLAISETGGYELDGFLDAGGAPGGAATRGAGQRGPAAAPVGISSALGGSGRVVFPPTPLELMQLPSSAGTAVSTPSLEVVDARFALPHCADDPLGQQGMCSAGFGNSGSFSSPEALSARAPRPPHMVSPRSPRLVFAASAGAPPIPIAEAAPLLLLPLAPSFPSHSDVSTLPLTNAKHGVDELLEELDGLLNPPV